MTHVAPSVGFGNAFEQAWNILQCVVFGRLMRMRPSRQFVAAVIVSAVVAVATLAAQQATRPAAVATTISPTDATGRIVAAAQDVLKGLDATGRAAVQFPLDGPQKTRWSNLPSPMFERRGLRLADITPPQRAAVMKLLATALSRDGYQKVLNIMEGDEVLRQNGDGRGGGRGFGRGGPAFGREQYYLAFLGTPSTTQPWTLQYGGHHLAINLTIGGGQASMTPSLPAAQPATFTVEGRTVRPLGDENDKAFALVNALDAPQRSQAILNYRVADLVLGPGQDGRTIQPEGLRASMMTPAQQTMLLGLIEEWTGIMTDAYAAPRLAEITGTLPQTWFAWSGPTTNGSAAYFRVQGPTIVIEYAPQGGVDHIHTIYRDPTNDYGAKFARR